MNNTKVNDYETIKERLNNGLVSFLNVENEQNSPTILPFDELAIRRSEGYSPGDYVYYFANEKYYIKRIIKLDYDKVYVKADNEEMVYIISTDQVLGKGISIQRGLKRISLVVIRNKFKVRKYIKKGLKFIENNFVENDEYIIPIIEQTKKKKKENKPVLPLDAKLQNELAHFKSVEAKVEEFYNPDLTDDEE